VGYTQGMNQILAIFLEWFFMVLDLVDLEKIKYIGLLSIF
jgi:hypothetical protein